MCSTGQHGRVSTEYLWEWFSFTDLWAERDIGRHAAPLSKAGVSHSVGFHQSSSVLKGKERKHKDHGCVNSAANCHLLHLMRPLDILLTNAHILLNHSQLTKSLRGICNSKEVLLTIYFLWHHLKIVWIQREKERKWTPFRR